jgi:hypothetical protein
VSQRVATLRGAYPSGLDPLRLVRTVRCPSRRARRLQHDLRTEKWDAWRPETYRGGAIAVSETKDHTRIVVALCTARGPQVLLTDHNEPDLSWFEQVRTCAFSGRHPVFGTLVDQTRVDVFKARTGGAAMRFWLPTNNLPATSPALLEPSGSYPNACSTDRYLGTTENFAPAVRLALRNCVQGN